MDRERDIIGSIKGRAVYKDEFEYYILVDGMRLAIDYDKNKRK